MSPTQRLFGRRCRTLLPMSDTLLKPRYDQAGEVLELRRAKAKQAFYYNKKVREQPPLEASDTVLMSLPDGAGLEKEWTAVKVMNKVGPRSYQVGTGNMVWRRNRCHLLLQRQREAAVDRPVGGANQELEEIPSKGDAPAPEGRHEDNQERNSNEQATVGADTAESAVRRTIRNVTRPVRWGYDE